MKEVFSFSGSLMKFIILEHKGIFYLRKSKEGSNILKCDNINIAKAYIDGFMKCIDMLPTEAYKLCKTSNNFNGVMI